MTLLETVRARRQEILALAARDGLKDVRIFGSVARGEESETSDIDILVNVADASNPFAFMDFQDELARILARPIDLVFESGLYHGLRKHILSEALPL